MRVWVVIFSSISTGVKGDEKNGAEFGGVKMGARIVLSMR